MPEPGTTPRTVLLLPGQGSQYPRMGAGLYGHEPCFTASMDDFFADFGAAGGPAAELRGVWLGTAPGPHARAAASVDEARFAQPLLYAVGIALGRVLAAHGARPDVLLGHSVGELAAASLGGVLDPRDGARVMGARGRLIDLIPPGGMLAVAAAPERMAAYTGSEVVIGAVNGPRQTVLAGPRAPLREVELALRADGITCRAVGGDRPFHSPAAQAAADAFGRVLAAVPLRTPATPIQSSATAAPVTPAQATRPGFWAGQIAGPVLYWTALSALLADPYAWRLVEAGPGHQMATPARLHRAVRRGGGTVTTLLPAEPGPPERDRDHLARALEQLSGVRQRS
ncbi:acyltransferase domain-containing protein [Yinghuangia sp. ASG 101]|uniref:acyltransferase domain-containing protein n=1 Tax=Yinghuangia sp. ASG 101 TaxID=2896848 RepID=UPI001E415A60|nr:acyltransferase domain-containing protein [Yinghuangia sp. ASG 101]UGQ11787.1 acyltransferase domain-containing protein [Yinghuangia sp. ASG 101]